MEMSGDDVRVLLDYTDKKTGAVAHHAFTLSKLGDGGSGNETYALLCDLHEVCSYLCMCA